MAVERVPYQVVLRAIGAYLDDRTASASNVIETLDGFAVRYQRKPDSPDSDFSRFSYDDLVELKVHLEWHRTPARGKSGRARALGGYQDFFRALGYELDQVSAYYILLEEVGDNLLVTYLQLDPAHTLLTHKRMIVAGPDEKQAVIESAHRRREVGSGQSGLLDQLAQTNTSQTGARDGAPSPRRQSAPPTEAPWEIGERQLYSTELKNAWIGPQEAHGNSQLVLTNRRLVLRFGDGSMYRAALSGITDTSTAVRRDLLSKRYRVEVHQSDGGQLNLDCFDQNHMDEVVDQIGQARAGGHP